MTTRSAAAIYIYKWACHHETVYAWGVDERGQSVSLEYPQQDFILIDRPEDPTLLPGLSPLPRSYIDEYGGGTVYDQLWQLENSVGHLSLDMLRFIGQHPERYKYKRALMQHLDPLHKYFILKKIPFYSGWFTPRPLTPLTDRKDLPPFTVLFYDIECVPAMENRFPNELDPMDVIGSISFIVCRLISDQPPVLLKSTVLLVTQRRESWSTPQYDVVACGSEKELLRRALTLFRDPTVQFISGFNTARFDDKYLAGRYYYHALEKQVFKGTYPFKDDGLCCLWYQASQLCIDVYSFYKNYHRYPAYSLDFLAKEILNDRKKIMDYQDMRRIFVQIETASHDEIHRVLDYNYHDSWITLQLFCQAKILDFTLNISAICYLNLERVILAGKNELLQGYIAIEAFKNGYLINDTRTHYGTALVKSPYEGALVFLEKPGVYSNISVLDFKSLYPSIISAKNLSPSTCSLHPTRPPPETEVDWIPVSQDQYCWSVKKSVRVGLMPLICLRLLEARQTIQTQLKDPDLSLVVKRYLSFLQLAIKIINNSLYGQLGSPYSVYYCKRVAEAVTAHSRATIRQARDYFQSRGIPCVFGDTDSLFIMTDTEERGRVLTQEVNQYIHIDQLTMEYETFYTRLFLYSKKKYCGLMGSKFKASGFELRKKDFPFFCKSILETILLLVLTQPEKLLTDIYQLTEALFRFDYSYRYEYFSKHINLKALYKYSPECKAPHVQFVKRREDKTPILQGQFVSLLKSPLVHHQKMGHGLGLVDANHRIIGHPDPIPVHIAHALKSTCTLFDKIFLIIFQDQAEAMKRVRHHFMQVQATLTKFNLVLFELNCIFNSVVVTFDKRICLTTVRPKHTSPNTLDDYLGSQKRARLMTP